MDVGYMCYSMYCRDSHCSHRDTVLISAGRRGRRCAHMWVRAGRLLIHVERKMDLAHLRDYHVHRAARYKHDIARDGTQNGE